MSLRELRKSVSCTYIEENPSNMRQSFAFLLEKALLKAPVKLQHSKRFGRSLVASRKIKAGETILREEPWYKSDISDQPELIERLDLDSVEDLKTGEAADQKAAAIFVGNSHPCSNFFFETPMKKVNPQTRKPKPRKKFQWADQPDFVQIFKHFLAVGG